VLRTLGPSPRAFIDPSGAPAFGSYAGPLPAVDLGRPGFGARFARRKRWVYLALSTEEVWLSLAIVRTGYAATAFAFVYDLAGAMLFERTALLPAPLARVGDDFHAPGVIARFASGATRLSLRRGPLGVEVDVRFGDLSVDAVLSERGAPPSVSAIAPLGEGLLDATEKRALLPVKGRARCGSRELSLDGALGGYDYTHGLLPRHTRWRWAFGMGRAKGGERLGFNVVSGFVGALECAAFLGDTVAPLGEAHIDFEEVSPMKPWRVVGEGYELTFAPGALHAETRDLVLVRSRFVQPVGTFQGTIRVHDRELVVDGLPGVVEDQDVLW
jgi:hypothetical protein